MKDQYAHSILGGGRRQPPPLWFLQRGKRSVHTAVGIASAVTAVHRTIAAAAVEVADNIPSDLPRRQKHPRRRRQ